MSESTSTRKPADEDNAGDRASDQVIRLDSEREQRRGAAPVVEDDELEAPVAPEPATLEAPSAQPKSASVTVAPPAPAKPRRSLTRPILFALLPIALVAGGYYYVVGGQIMTTDNAYIQAQSLSVSTDVSGIVFEINVHENEAVKKDLYRHKRFWGPNVQADQSQPVAHGLGVVDRLLARDGIDGGLRPPIIAHPGRGVIWPPTFRLELVMAQKVHQLQVVFLADPEEIEQLLVAAAGFGESLLQERPDLLPFEVALQVRFMNETPERAFATDQPLIESRGHPGEGRGLPLPEA